MAAKILAKDRSNTTMSNASKRINDFKTSLISATTAPMPHSAPPQQSRKRASSPGWDHHHQIEDDNNKEDDEEMIISVQRPQSVLEQFNKKEPPVQHNGLSKLLNVAASLNIFTKKAKETTVAVRKGNKKQKVIKPDVIYHDNIELSKTEQEDAATIADDVAELQQQQPIIYAPSVIIDDLPATQSSYLAQIQSQIRAAAAQLLDDDNQLTQQQETSLICQSAIHAMKQCDTMKQLMQSTMLLSDQVADAVQALAGSSSSSRYLAPCTPPPHCISPLKLSATEEENGFAANLLQEWSMLQESPTTFDKNQQVMRACEKYSPQFL